MSKETHARLDYGSIRTWCMSNIYVKMMHDGVFEGDIDDEGGVEAKNDTRLASRRPQGSTYPKHDSKTATGG